MDLTAGLLPDKLLWASWLLYTFLTLATFARAPWWKLLENESLNIYLGAIVFLLFFWNVKAGIYPGQEFHFLGATAVCLMFNWQFGWLAIQAVILILTVLGKMGWDAFAMNAILMGAIPVTVAHLLRRLTQRFLPHNFFIYIFINAFFAAALGILVSGLASYGVLSSGGIYPEASLKEQFLPVYLLLSFPEALLNGFAITLLVVYKPDWVATFHDRTYLAKSKQKKRQ